MADAQRQGLFSFFGKKPEDSESAGAERLRDATESFLTLRVDDIMVPRADIVSIEVSATLQELLTQFRESAHSRMPVFHETLDEPVGMIHIKDVVNYLQPAIEGGQMFDLLERQIINDTKRPVLFVPPSMRVEALLARMQARRIHMAIVVDEYGGTDGLVTLEDVVETLVGNIEDEHDEDEIQLKTLKDGWDADARISIDDFEAAAGQEFATPDEEDDVDTLGGLVFTLAGRVPLRGEILRHPSGFEFEVTDADPRRVKRLRIRKRVVRPEA